MRRDTEKGKAYRENYLRRERRLDVNEFKSIKICPSAPSSKIPTLYYSEVQENEVFFKWTTKMLQENILNPSILTDMSKTNNDQVCLWTSGLWMLHSCKFLPAFTCDQQLQALTTDYRTEKGNPSHKSSLKHSNISISLLNTAFQYNSIELLSIRISSNSLNCYLSI